MPRWILVRDFLLTVAAWVLLVFLLRDAIYLTFDYFGPAVFQGSVAEPPQIGLLWDRLTPFIVLSAGLVFLLCVWALVNRGRLLPRSFPTPPPELTLAEHAAKMGIEEKRVRHARHFKITRVSFRQNGTVSALDSVPTTRPPSFP